MFVVMHGTPITGLGVLGPFATEEAASEWAEGNIKEEWWGVCPLLLPNDHAKGSESEPKKKGRG